MKGNITWVGTNSKQVKAEIEEILKDLEQPQNQPDDVQPVTWEQATKDLEISQQPSQETEIER